MITRKKKLIAILITVVLIQSCSIESPQGIEHASTIVAPTSLTTDTPLLSSVVSQDDLVNLLPTPLSVSTIDVSALTPDFWMDLPVIPDGISNNVREIYQRGIMMGNDPHAFSKVGDCHSTNPYFLADYDLGPSVYDLGEYVDLQVTIDYFGGSFGRTSLSAKQGLSTAGVLASLWSDWKQCASNETPLDCEYRLHHPSFAIISLGTNEAYDVKLDKTPFEGRLRRIIEHSIDQGVVPILSTKADNEEGDHYINYVTAKLALEYELPLWNFWKAVQPISQNGMRNADHLTFAPTKSFTDFSDPEYLDYGMQMRNLTALLVMDMIRREIDQPKIIPTATLVTQTVLPTPVVNYEGETIISSVDGATLVFIPANDFEMGSNSGDLDESPVHSVSLSAYWMDQTEVTNAMYANFLNTAGNRMEGGTTWLDLDDPLIWISEQSGVWQVLAGKADYPVVGVSWYGAKAYCEWVGRTLPTEAQWEYAAKGEAGFRFPWGSRGLDCSYSQFLGCGSRPVQVGSLLPGVSPFGIFDMAGNVAEWVNDRYAADYYQQAPGDDPVGPINGYYRVTRGGSWGSSYIGLQTTHRDWAGADTQDSEIGFRCALNP
jgi:formylglycine-generating enzyme required for sulfatase activity